MWSQSAFLAGAFKMFIMELKFPHVSWFNPSHQLSTTQALAHSPLVREN